jgi:3'(2'), 5'-bisphosphate nucleotidase
MKTMDNFEYSEVLPPVLFAAKKAGEAILEVYNSDFNVEQKVDKSPLTLADKRSHEIIFHHLNSFTSHLIPILSEEGKEIPYEERKNWEHFWLVDPLDGTKEFIKRNGEFTVNIALILKSRPVLGVIYIPVKGLFYFGAEGLGAFKLEKSVLVRGKEGEMKLNELVKGSYRLPLNNHKSKFTVIGSRSHMTKETEEYINKLKEKHGEIEIISAGSSLKFCLIAEGKAEIYPRFAPTMEWDTAAGQVIVEQAGGDVLTAKEGEVLKYNKEELRNPWFIVRKYNGREVF